MAGTVKAYREGDSSAPAFPANFKVVKHQIFQKADLGENNNKYYSIELHDGMSSFRVFTHYGRLDDLESNPDAGAKESRFFSSQHEAQREYDRIIKQKTGDRKGYKEISVAASKIGSSAVRGKSAGELDSKTLEKIQPKEEEAKVEQLPKVTIDESIRNLVSYLYGEATTALTATVQAKITAKGIETPLGILTIGQIDKGESILKEIYALIQLGAQPHHGDLFHKSSAFYTAIPHKLGRTKADLQSAFIGTVQAVSEKQETLQLMRDMLTVNGEKGNVLASDDVVQKYQALSCTIEPLASNHPKRMEIEEYIRKSLVKSKDVHPTNVFEVRRPGEYEVYEEKVGNHKMLFHGSRSKNWVGLLSRGILMPKIVQTMGVHRTDAGWLGNGIYFGDAACTAAFYATAGKKGTKFMAICQVALGKIRDYHNITYGLESAPPGYDSNHGVRRKPGVSSQFDDDEFVVYRTSQQKMLYLVEFKHGG
jgi:poly [ADP-ribose] polymerase 2/3/4